jgi:hypothetical protein
MPKYLVTETLYVEFAIEAETAQEAQDKYMNAWIKQFITKNEIKVNNGENLTVRQNVDGRLVEVELDPPHPESLD